MTNQQDGNCWRCKKELRAYEYGICAYCEASEMMRQDVKKRSWPPLASRSQFNSLSEMVERGNMGNASVVKDTMRGLLERIEQLEVKLAQQEATKEVIPSLKKMVSDLE